uniref:Uncharacterized protein n=1 Tax=Ixodes ricinus TaxID=34613 RepID=A0A6B0US23_IXORI
MLLFGPGSWVSFGGWGTVEWPCVWCSPIPIPNVCGNAQLQSHWPTVSDFLLHCCTLEIVSPHVSLGSMHGDKIVCLLQPLLGWEVLRGLTHLQIDRCCSRWDCAGVCPSIISVSSCIQCGSLQYMTRAETSRI